MDMQSVQHEADHLDYEEVDLLEDLSTIQDLFDGMDLFTESAKSDNLPAFSTSPQYAVRRNKFSHDIDLFLDLIQSESSTEMVEKADHQYSMLRKLKQENQKSCLAAIRPLEVPSHAANLFFRNAAKGGDSVDNARFMLVDPNRFAGANNTRHFNLMAKYLQDKFYAFRLTESPAFISYAGDIGTGAGDLALIANQTIAMAIVDTNPGRSPELACENAKMLPLRGIESHWGHLAVSGTWLIARKAYPGLEEEDLLVPSSCAVAGKLMSCDLTDSIAGFEGGTILGARGTAYYADTRDSKKFKDNNMFIIGWEEGAARIFGDTTANQSSSKDYSYLRKISKMMVYNIIMKDLVDFCNLKAFSKWGRKERISYLEQLQTYLNEKVRRGLIQGYVDLEVIDLGEDEVQVLVRLIFFETKNTFDIDIKGSKGQMELETQKQSKP